MDYSLVEAIIIGLLLKLFQKSMASKMSRCLNHFGFVPPEFVNYLLFCTYLHSKYKKH